MHLRVKPAILQHLLNTLSNHQTHFLVVLKCLVLQSLKASGFEELNNQKFLNVCYARSAVSSDVTKGKLLTDWSELRVSQGR